VAPDAKSLNILVVDNGNSTTAPVSVVLKQAGHRVDVVHDGEYALSSITQEPARYHLVITDHRMKFTGLELATGLRKIAFPGKILILSAFLPTEAEDAYRLLGVETFIFKPFDIADLRNAVEKLARSER